MEKFKEYATVYTIGSVAYSWLEVAWRGFTHWSMTLAGGVGFLLLYLTDWRLKGRSLLERAAAGCAVLTSVEFLFGCVVNKLLRLDVWDYSKERGNLFGQVCPLYTILWFLLCIPVMPASRELREKLLHQQEYVQLTA
ncbi:MAG: hypothetical protein HFG20_05380 [Anaerotruncus sp.]|nr:hypothetical protein [Anaerotruncus sp.]